jgi:hypothetical protein
VVAGDVGRQGYLAHRRQQVEGPKPGCGECCPRGPPSRLHDRETGFDPFADHQLLTGWSKPVVSQDVVQELGGGDLGGGSGRSGSCGRGGQHEGEIIAQGRDRLQRQVAGPRHGPFDGMDRPRDRWPWQAGWS